MSVLFFFKPLIAPGTINFYFMNINGDCIELPYKKSELIQIRIVIVRKYFTQWHF